MRASHAPPELTPSRDPPSALLARVDFTPPLSPVRALLAHLDISHFPEQVACNVLPEVTRRISATVCAPLAPQALSPLQDHPPASHALPDW